MSFLPHHWPPGRACTPGNYRWEHYPCTPNGTPVWAVDFDTHLRAMNLSRTNDRRVRTTILTALRRAERGELSVVVKTSWSHKRTGHVDQMGVAKGKILEIRLEEIEGEELIKGKRLRLYFAEPATQETLLGLVFAPKDVSDDTWKEQQNQAVQRAQRQADEWWAQP